MSKVFFVVPVPAPALVRSSRSFSGNLVRFGQDFTISTSSQRRSSRSFSGNLVRFGQDFTISTSSQRRRGSRCVAKALFSNFSKKSMDVVQLAKEEARRLGHNFIGREELLLGIIAEGSSIAAKVLSSMGINLKDARVEVENVVGRGTGVVTSDVIYTLHAMCALKLSMEVSLQLGHKYIGPEHLLLGLLRETEGVAARILENSGADLRKIDKEVIRKIAEIEAASGKTMSMTTLGDLIKPTKFEVKQMANVMLQQVIDSLKGKEINLHVTERFRERMVEEGYDPSYGARLRPLRRAMRFLEDSMEEKMLAGEIKEGDSLTVDIDSDGNIMVLNGQ